MRVGSNVVTKHTVSVHLPLLKQESPLYARSANITPAARQVNNFVRRQLSAKPPAPKMLNPLKGSSQALPPMLALLGGCGRGAAGRYRGGKRLRLRTPRGKTCTEWFMPEHRHRETVRLTQASTIPLSIPRDCSPYSHGFVSVRPQQ